MPRTGRGRRLQNPRRSQDPLRFRRDAAGPDAQDRGHRPRGVKSLSCRSTTSAAAAVAHGDWADARFLVSGAKPRAIDFPYEKGYVLTPPSPPTPRINGAKIFGVRPGSPFFFTIPATGQRPMTFAVENLPAGLSVDPADRPHHRHAWTSAAVRGHVPGDQRPGHGPPRFTIVCGDTLALTPEMGWNSWYFWTDRVSDKVMRDAADAMVASGMINHGYIYVNIDDCWANSPGSKTPISAVRRDAAGKVSPTGDFPT